mmetsp:Transcript_6112/g.25518  ORF Transcript_6112/g.25518 Transcript_6112/m.25518 type:complete len:266 (-) Transcript_6112:1686-2483(-)
MQAWCSESATRLVETPRLARPRGRPLRLASPGRTQRLRRSSLPGACCRWRAAAAGAVPAMPTLTSAVALAATAPRPSQLLLLLLLLHRRRRKVRQQGLPRAASPIQAPPACLRWRWRRVRQTGRAWRRPLSEAAPQPPTWPRPQLMRRRPRRPWRTRDWRRRPQRPPPLTRSQPPLLQRRAAGGRQPGTFRATACTATRRRRPGLPCPLRCSSWGLPSSATQRSIETRRRPGRARRAGRPRRLIARRELRPEPLTAWPPRRRPPC